MEKNKDAATAQANSLNIIKDKKLLLAGCEDNFVRIFDLNTGKIIKKLQSDSSVSCVAGYEWSIIGGDHSGSLLTWDARVFKLIDKK